MRISQHISQTFILMKVTTPLIIQSSSGFKEYKLETAKVNTLYLKSWKMQKKYIRKEIGTAYDHKLCIELQRFTHIFF